MKGIENTKDSNDVVWARRPALELAILLAGSLLVGFSMGRWLAPLAAWIGPALIMRYARNHRIGRGYILVLTACILSMIIGFGSSWTAEWGIPAAAILALLYGFLWSLPYLADRLVTPRLGGFSGTFVYPLAATTLEFVNVNVNPVGAWGVTGFTQYGILSLTQLASVTGMIGITFLMGWFASVVNWAWEKRSSGRDVLKGVVAFAAVLTVVLLFGFLRLNLARSAETIRVAGITAQSIDTFEANLGEAPDEESIQQATQAHWEAYMEETVREAEAGADLVLWPEQAGLTSGPYRVALVAQAQEIARQKEIYLALGHWIQEAEKTPENRLLVIDPAGDVVIDHLKYGGALFEDSLTGEGELQAVTTPFGVLSGAICWDLDFPAVVQQAGLNETSLMLAPSRDWYEIDPIHSHMAAFRAIENGMSVVRQTDKGLSIAYDPYGRTLAQTDFFEATDRTMVAQVPVERVATLYTSFGRWLGWVFAAGFLFVVAVALIAGRRRR